MPKPISTTIRVSDKASAPLLTISKNLGKCIGGFMRLNQVSSNAISINTMGSCESILQNIDANIDEITKSLRQSETAADSLTESMSRSHAGSSNLLSTVKKLAGTYLTLQAAGKVIETSDAIVAGKQRLSLALKEGEVIDEVNRKIMSSANSARASYTDTLNQVSKLAMNAGDAFSNTDQAIKFVEQFNKLGALGGASVYESSQAMYQLTQSMAKGKLDGDELRSVMEGMPLVAQTIAEYLGTDVGTMKELAAEGQVTAEVVRNALLGSAVETDAAFKDMPYTWAQALEVFKNNAIQAFTPVLERINAIANNQKVQSFIGGLMNGIHGVANITMFLFDVLSSVFGFIYDNLSWLSPLLMGVLGILGVYLLTTKGLALAQVAYTAVMGAFKAVQGFVTIGYWVLRGSTTAAAAAQTVYNSALLACPLTWIIILIIALIAIIYAVVAAINKVTGSTISATGIIFGAITTLVAAIWNIVVGVINAIIQFGWTYFVEPWISIIEFVLNVFNGGFNSFGDAVKNLLGNIISWFLSLGKAVTKIIDAIFGTNWTSGLESLQDNVLAWGKNENAITISREAPDLGDIGVNRWEYGDAWETGYNFGEGIENKVGDMFDFSAYTDGIDEKDYGGVLGEIENNTGKGVDISQEDLKYLRDIAEQQAINRFTTAEIRVEMNNNNNINNGMDLDGVVDHLAMRVTEAMDAAAAGAY